MRIVATLLLAMMGLLVTTARAQGSSPADAPLRHGDRLLVRVWADSSFADSARVDGAGAVVLPVIGRVMISGLSAPAAVETVREAYAKVIRGSAIDVIPLRRVVVSGEVQRPGVYFLEPQVSVREAVAVAGGVTGIANSGTLTVSRDSTRLELTDWARREDPQTVVRSGDVIWVERESWMKRNAVGLLSAVGVLASVVVALTN